MTYELDLSPRPPFVDRLRLWWRDTLDEDSVRKWVAPYCVIWLAWATLALFVFPPVPSIHEELGAVVYWFWVGAAIPANLLPIIGLRMRHGGSALKNMSTPLLFMDWMGLVAQAVGHLVCHLLLVLFEVTAWVVAFTYKGPNAYAGLTIFCATMLLAWTGGTLVLFAQCMRKIQRGRELEREAAQRARDAQEMAP